MVLSERDRTELHDAIVDYLSKRGCEAQALDTVKQTLKATPIVAVSAEGTLEKRWNTLRRLNSRNMELEAQCKLLQNELRELQDPNVSKGKTKDKLPSEPSLFTFRGHRDTLTAVLQHPTEPTAYTASEDGSIRVWDTTNKICVSTINEHLDNVSAIALEPVEAKLLASGSNDRTVKLYNAQTMECTRTLYGHDEAVNCIRWVGDDAKTLLSGGRDGVRVWDTLRASSKHTFHPVWIRDLAFPEVGSTTVACVGNDEIISLWNWQTAQPIGDIGGVHTNAVHTVTFSNIEADTVLISNHGTEDMKETLKRYERSVRVAESTAAATGAAAADVPKYEARFVVTAGRDKAIVFTDLVAKTQFFSLSHHDNWVQQIAFSGNGKSLISCGDDGMVLITDLATKRLSRRIAAHDNFVLCFDLHYGGRPMLLTGSADHTMKVWPCN